LPALFHRLAPADALVEQAAELCRRFGLPGLPLDPPRRLSETELARAACARAFLGRPELLLLESPLRGGTLADLRLPLLEAIASARDAACLWLTSSPSVWADRAIPARRRFRLSPQGLQAMRRAAA
jgi:phospholipid/cholesterol/gamma-HCH transport system ATP-binding protein